MELKVFRDTLSAAGSFYTVRSEIPIETEILISDYLPQVFKIVKCLVRMVVLQKRLQPGHLLLEGYLRCVVYYQGEEGAGLCQTEQKLSFSKTMELPAEDFSDWSATVGGEAEYLNCRAVNQRRVEIRGAWGLSAAVFTQQRREVVCAVAGGAAAQKQTILTGLRSIAAVDKLITAETQFAFDRQPQAVLDISGTGQLREQKLLRGKAVLKGEIAAQLACRTAGEETLTAQRVSLPIQQILDVDDLAEDCLCFAVLEPVGFALEAKPDEEGKNKLTVSAMLHLRAFRPFELAAVADVFSTRFETQNTFVDLAPELQAKTWNELQSVTVRLPLPEENVRVLACFAVPGVPEWAHIEGRTALRVRVQFSLLCAGSLDEVECIEKAGELILPMEPGADETALHPELWLSVEGMHCMPGGSEAELTADLRLEGVLLRRHTARVLTDVTLGEPLQPDDPEVVLRICCAAPGEQVFDVARRFHVSPARILQANGLSGETLAEGARLLVPCAE